MGRSIGEREGDVTRYLNCCVSDIRKKVLVVFKSIHKVTISSL